MAYTACRPPPNTATAGARRGMARPVSLSQQLFGREDFTRVHFQQDRVWCLFSNMPYVLSAWTVHATGQHFVLQENPDGSMRGDMVKHVHATTLWQAGLLLNNGFEVGLHHQGTQSSPCGMWGCTRRGDCFERARLQRGWSKHAGESPSVPGIAR